MELTANEIRQELFMRINQAQVHYDLFSALKECTAEHENLVKFNHNVRFFSGVESALFNSTVVLLYTLYETRSNTINFNRLLNLLQTNGTTSDIDSYKARVAAIKPTWVRVGIIRNEMVGHQTISHNRAAVQSKANLSFSDIDTLLEHARSLLFDISHSVFDTHMDFMDNSKNSVNQLLTRVVL